MLCNTHKLFESRLFFGRRFLVNFPLLRTFRHPCGAGRTHRPPVTMKKGPPWTSRLESPLITRPPGPPRGPECARGSQGPGGRGGSPRWLLEMKAEGAFDSFTLSHLGPSPVVEMGTMVSSSAASGGRIWSVTGRGQRARVNTGSLASGPPGGILLNTPVTSLTPKAGAVSWCTFL